MYLITELIKEALDEVQNPNIIESLGAQQRYHESQETILRQRQKYLIAQIADLRKRREEMEQRENQDVMNKLNKVASNKELNDGGSSGGRSKSNSESEGHARPQGLETQIFRVLDEHDSLLQILVQRKHINKLDLDDSVDEIDGSQAMAAISSSRLIPKNDKVVIEELQTVNEQLRDLVAKLIGELERSQAEIRALRTENEKLKAENESHKRFDVLGELPPLERPILPY